HNEEKIPGVRLAGVLVREGGAAGGTEAPEDEPPTPAPAPPPPPPCRSPRLNVSGMNWTPLSRASSSFCRLKSATIRCASSAQTVSVKSLWVCRSTRTLTWPPLLITAKQTP